MTLDEAIQKFAAYSCGEGDFDELDLKEYLVDVYAKEQRRAAFNNGMASARHNCITFGCSCKPDNERIETLQKDEL